MTEEKEELQERGNVCVYVCERDKQSETDRDSQKQSETESDSLTSRIISLNEVMHPL